MAMHAVVQVDGESFKNVSNALAVAGLGSRGSCRAGHDIHGAVHRGMTQVVARQVQPSLAPDSEETNLNLGISAFRSSLPTGHILKVRQIDLATMKLDWACG
jgi:hypothetical protein